MQEITWKFQAHTLLCPPAWPLIINTFMFELHVPVPLWCSVTSLTTQIKMRCVPRVYQYPCACAFGTSGISQICKRALGVNLLGSDLGKSALKQRCRKCPVFISGHDMEKQQPIDSSHDLDQD